MKREFYWRPRREGDKLLLRGIHRSVRKLYREAGFSPAMRATLPLLCDKEGVVWIPFIGARDGAVSDGEDGICISLERDPENGGAPIHKSRFSNGGF